MSEEKRNLVNSRFSSKRKTEAVLRLLRGESLELLSQEYGVTTSCLRQWRDAFLVDIPPTLWTSG
jgi:hypothetical protein